MSIASPDDTDPREFALQLAVIAARLDERSARAVQRVEAASAELGRQAASAAQALARERREAATIQQKVVESRIRVLMVASAALLVGALVAVAGASLAVSSAQRELDALGQDRGLLQAIDRADLTLCGERLCARVEGAGSGDYRPIAARVGAPIEPATR